MFPVMAHVEQASTVVTATDLPLGNYTANNFGTATPLDSTMTVDTPYPGCGWLQMFMDDRMFPQVAGCPATPSRRMAAIVTVVGGIVLEALPEAANTRLPYDIYQDAQRIAPIGCNNANGVLFAGASG